MQPLRLEEVSVCLERASLETRLDGMFTSTFPTYIDKWADLTCLMDLINTK